MSLLTILVIFVVIALFFGAFGWQRVGPVAPWAGGWSPVGLLLVLVLVLWLTGHLGHVPR